ncbi:MAG: DUF192 domain-containing protein [Candidatus Daviesbacteria bacterium]|nr:DUF192 domain-containing protein [Candidatus Daviesbacteria bacterium]
MKKFVIQIILLLVFIIGGVYLYKTSGQISGLPFIPQGPVFKQIQINGSKLNVEIADTQDKRAKGLAGRDSLASDSGMLFIFSEPSKHSFWMKGLLFPLDFIWISGDRVVSILQNVPPPAQGQSDSSLPIYQSSVEVDKVLEVNAGVIQRLNIKVGDSLTQ